MQIIQYLKSMWILKISKADYINSKESTQGVNNTLVLNFLNNPSKKEGLNILLAKINI